MKTIRLTDQAHLAVRVALGVHQEQLNKELNELRTKPLSDPTVFERFQELCARVERINNAMQEVG